MLDKYLPNTTPEPELLPPGSSRSSGVLGRLPSRQSLSSQEVFGYKTGGFRRALCLAGYVLSCGGLLLLFHWKPEWDVWANCQPCSLEEADVVLLRSTDEFQICTRKKVTWIPLSTHLKPSSLATEDEESLPNRVIEKPGFKVRSLQVQKIRYAWDFSAREFRKVGALEDHYSPLEIHAKFGAGLTSAQQELRREISGPNAIDIEVTPVWKLLVKEVLHPFYIFQAFSVCLWFAESYSEYAVAIIIMSLLSISLTVYDLRKQSVKLHQLVESHNSVLVKVFRKETGAQEVESRHLVPGDILVLDEGRSLMSCDALLLSGQCVVNEGMLTGESLPVTKTALPQECKSSQPWHLGSSEDSRRHLLFCGTDVIQARGGDAGPARAIVLRTGFNTAKGDLVRSILYPKPMNFRLYRDALQFLLCLVVAAGIGMVYAICVFVINGQEAGEVVKKALDVITIAVPPALPAALTTGIIYAQRRLKKKGIFCISPQRINVCGQLNLVCFDKVTSGRGPRGVGLALFQAAHRFSSGPRMPWGPASAAMACCHSLMVLDGKVQGDPLDLKMFEATHWELVDSAGGEGGPADVLVVRPGPEAAEVSGLAVLRQFPFSSALQRMTVVAQELPGDGRVFMKGAPEMVAGFCQPETVPPSFARELQGCTSQGFRVIALAHKRLQEGQLAASLTREELESGLTFLGLLVMENRLKSETRPVLQELHQARIRSVMVTGDNLQTAITVARNAGMIPQGSRVILVEASAGPGRPLASVSWEELEEPSQEDALGYLHGRQEGKRCRGFHFCLTGGSYEVLSQHFGQLLPQLLLNGTVFARMSPAQKAHLVQQFQQGIGQEGALKEAHAGISLSEQDASVASPFTSTVPTIECVPELIRHGRAALVTSFCMFKYMALFSLASYVGVLLLYWQLNSFGNYQFLFLDLAITTVIGMTTDPPLPPRAGGPNGPHPKLAPHRPPTQLIAPPLLLSVVLNLLFSLAVQLCGFLLVQRQPWYSPTLGGLPSPLPSSACSPGNSSQGPGPRTPLPREGFQSYENTSVWLLCTLNCLTAALVFSKGRPFREPLYKNYVFVVVLAVQLAVCLFFLFANIDGLYGWGMGTFCPARPPADLLPLSPPPQEWVIENRALWRWLKGATGYQSSSRYKQLQRALRQDPAWPPSNRTDFSGSLAVPLEGPGPTYTNPAFVSHEPPCHQG
uniref:Cation-transporting ATPase n=1 Tax=Pseudonaja textilis TaxID=8673 RepID=A0A670Z0W6_PSETE